MNCRKTKNWTPSYLAPYESWLKTKHWMVLEANQRQQQQNQEDTRTIRIPQITIRTATIAAVILVCAGIGLAILPGQVCEEHDFVQQTNISDTLSLRDLEGIPITENGVAVASSILLTTDSTTLRELLINDRHRLVINRDAILSIDRLAKDEKVGCSIPLRWGELLAEVNHDGNPFEVLAPHGKAVIKGTILDVSATRQETTLIAIEGSVRFESSEGRVDVGAGFQSTLQAHSRPSSPTRCDAQSLLAWATGTESNPVIQASPVDSEYAQFFETPPLRGILKVPLEQKTAILNFFRRQLAVICLTWSIE